MGRMTLAKPAPGGSNRLHSRKQAGAREEAVMAGEPAAAVRNAPGPAAPPGSPGGLAAVDREFQAFRARLAGGVSPIGFSRAYLVR